ncbi:MAG: histidine--tRNA ligase [Verrucomicrobiota bacterium]
MPSLPGFRDFYPADCALRNAIISAWRQAASAYGFAEYDGPPLEPLDLYTRKSGGEIVQQLYHFTDKGDREVALRPEMTPTLARMAAAKHREYKKPLKWFSVPQVFRYERAQRGRLREHFQFNCDIVGEAALHADVELISLVIDTLLRLGLQTEDFVVRLSDRQFWTQFLTDRNVPESDWYGIFQAIDKSEREDEAKTREKLGPLADEVIAILKGESNAASPQLDEVIASLEAAGYGDYLKRDLTIVRGLAYYTGVVFEVFDRQGEFRAIAAGGRYDDLLQNLCGVDLPALGFGMGDVVLGEILKSRQRGAGGTEAAPRLDAFLVVPEENFRPRALVLARKLRDQDLAVDLPLGDIHPKKLGKQFQTAEERGAAFAVIVDALLDSGRVAVKNLRERRQEEIPLEALSQHLRTAG